MMTRGLSLVNQETGRFVLEAQRGVLPLAFQGPRGKLAQLAL